MASVTKMGIKFLCPNGHKLHVKAFLSGKRAICPKCGARVVVPAENPAMAVGGSAESQTESVGDRSVEIPLEGSLVDDALETMDAVAEAESRPPPPPSSPIDEAPGAVWYVRPSGGGQYGPASGEIMRGWLAEGRVGPNSLVWRAGWSEWRNAAATFPQLGPQSSPSNAPPTPSSVSNGMPPLPVGHAVQSVAPSPEAPAPAEVTMPPLAQAARKRRRKKDLRLIASAILVVVSLILVIILVLVSRSSSGSSEPKAEEPPAADEEPLI